MRLKALDLVIVLAAAGAIALSAVSVYGRKGGRAEAAISGRDGEWIYPLSEDRELRVAGPLGETLVVIRGGKVRIADSPCLNKTCIASGSISEPNQWIACLPNRVFVRVEGGEAGEGIDAGAY